MKTSESSRSSLNNGIRFNQSIVVNQPANELFAVWRDFTNLPRFMTILKSVDLLEHGITRWNVDGPLGISISWDAEIINERQGELIAWKSLPNAQVGSAGTVRFIPVNDQQTEVKISARYDPPGGQVGMAIVALLLEDPERQIKDDLARFKYFAESEMPLAA